MERSLSSPRIASSSIGSSSRTCRSDISVVYIESIYYPTARGDRQLGSGPGRRHRDWRPGRPVVDRTAPSRHFFQEGTAPMAAPAPTASRRLRRRLVGSRVVAVTALSLAALASL